jgi:hypothetical protein
MDGSQREAYPQRGGAVNPRAVRPSTSSLVASLLRGSTAPLEPPAI